MHGPRQFLGEKRIHSALPLDAPLPRERLGHHGQVEMALPAGASVNAPFMMMPGVPGAVVLDRQDDGPQGFSQFFAHFSGDGSVLAHNSLVCSLMGGDSALQFG